LQPWTGGGDPGGAKKRERSKEELHNLRQAAPADDKAQQMPGYEPGKKAEGGFTLVGFQWDSGAP